MVLKIHFIFKYVMCVVLCVCMCTSVQVSFEARGVDLPSWVTLVTLVSSFLSLGISSLIYQRRQY